MIAHALNYTAYLITLVLLTRKLWK
jgi:hypothetical protein